ncbi:DUF6264 family protein [Leifsonia sp. NPDC058292]|uniref:DUF6264 family protein n=1 Tax=Leifsonia sp. NPDC058292 TaxID=3346428 RepID=UPI0036DB7CE1
MADDDKKPDERPRPQFGELAPEGWVWRPPADHDRLDTSQPLAPAETDPESERTQYAATRGTAAPPHTEHTASAHPYAAHGDPSAPRAQLRRAAPRWNLGWTIGLLILGFLGMSYSIGTLNALPAAMQLLHVNQSLGDYTAAPSVAGILTAGSITMGAIWVASAVITVLLLTRRRLSFYVPLIAGVVAFIALIVFVSLVLATDPDLMTVYGALAPATATPTL